MSLVWKRPDGYREAAPSDFYVASISADAKIWLHKSDKVNYPFRVSSGWQEEELTQRINELTNLICESDEALLSYLNECCSESELDKSDFLKEQLDFVKSLQKDLKGDHWELIIMDEVLNELRSRLEAIQSTFLV